MKGDIIRFVEAAYALDVQPRGPLSHLIERSAPLLVPMPGHATTVAPRDGFVDPHRRARHGGRAPWREDEAQGRPLAGRQRHSLAVAPRAPRGVCGPESPRTRRAARCRARRRSCPQQGAQRPRSRTRPVAGARLRPLVAGGPLRHRWPALHRRAKKPPGRTRPTRADAARAASAGPRGTGPSLKEIAYSPGLSVPTISIHRTRAMRKLGLRSQADVARLFEQGAPS
jgi:hypothetical protein